MDDYRKLVFRFNGVGTIGAAQRELIVKLPQEERRRFNRVYQHYLMTYGPHGFVERMNNRTVESILAEADSIDAPAPIESGERDGVRYQLFKLSPPEHPARPGPPSDLLDEDRGWLSGRPPVAALR